MCSLKPRQHPKGKEVSTLWENSPLHFYKIKNILTYPRLPSLHGKRSFSQTQSIVSQVKAQLGEVFSPPGPCALSNPQMAPGSCSQVKPSPQLCRVLLCSPPTKRANNQDFGCLSPAAFGKKLIWHLLNLLLFQQGRYLRL